MIQNDSVYTTPQSKLATSQNTPANDAGLFSFSGRIGRLRYLAYIAAISLLFLLAPFILILLFYPEQIPNTIDFSPQNIVSILLLLLLLLGCIAFIVFDIGFTVRRLNDCNQSGWFALLLFIPLVNILVGIYLMLAKGTQGVNDFGAPPKPNHWAIYIGAFVLIATVGMSSVMAVYTYLDYKRDIQEMQKMDAELFGQDFTQELNSL